MRSTGASASKGSQAAPVLAMAICATSSSGAARHPQADDVARADAARTRPRATAVAHGVHLAIGPGAALKANDHMIRARRHAGFENLAQQLIANQVAPDRAVKRGAGVGSGAVSRLRVVGDSLFFVQHQDTRLQISRAHHSHGLVQSSRELGLDSGLEGPSRRDGAMTRQLHAGYGLGTEPGVNELSPRRDLKSQRQMPFSKVRTRPCQMSMSGAAAGATPVRSTMSTRATPPWATTTTSGRSRFSIHGVRRWPSCS